LANGLDECIAGLVSTNTLQPAPPAGPTLYERLNDHYHDVKNVRRRIACELRHVHHQIANFQHVPRGRHLSLIVQQNEYSQREAELTTRRGNLQEYMEQHPELHPDDMMDSSDDEELVFGRDPAPVLDYGSDSDGPEEVRYHIGPGADAPVVTLRVEDVEAYTRDVGRQRRARRAARPSGTRISRAVEDALSLSGPVLPSYNEIMAGLQDAQDHYSQRTRSILVGTGTELATTAAITGDHVAYAGHEVYAGDSDDSLLVDEDEDEDEEDEEDVDVDESDFEPTPPDTVQHGETEMDVDPERPHNWQKWHQFFMYSCRGDVSEVTSQLQEMFRFVPEISQDWVARQLNKAENIHEQTEYLQVCLPGETGTLDRAEARQQMGLSGFFIQDTYDGKSAGQIFDIDPASDAYTEPIRPADLPVTWTPVLDATLLVVLPDIPLMETFWIENMDIFREDWAGGIGSSRRAHAISLRCGQLKYLRLSEDQLAVGRQREQARVEA
jgi:hypothetical protein